MPITKMDAVAHICQTLGCTKLFGARVWEQTQIEVYTDPDEGSSVEEALSELDGDFRRVEQMLRTADRRRGKELFRKGMAKVNRTRGVRLSLYLADGSCIEQILTKRTPADVLDLTPLGQSDGQYESRIYTLGNVIAYGVIDAFHLEVPEMHAPMESILYLRVEAA